MRTLLFMPLMLSCGDNKLSDGDTGGSSGGEGEGEGECSIDADCASWQICESTECVDGDRNNSLDQADELALVDDGASIDAYINTAGDSDYYTFESDGSHFIRAATIVGEFDEDAIPRADTILTLTDPNGDVVTFSDNYPNGGQVSGYDSVIYAYLAIAGTYSMEVEHQEEVTEAWGGSNYDYTLELSFWGWHTIGSTSSFESPYPITDGGLETDANTWYAIGVVIDEPGETDYVAVEFPYNNTGFYIDGIEELTGSDADPLVSLYSTDGTLLTERNDVGPNNGVYFPNMSSGSYVLGLSDGDGGGSNNHWYVVLLNAGDDDEAIDDEIEPNDISTQAKAIEMTRSENSSGNVFWSGWTQGSADQAGDVDWFSITVDDTPTAETDEGEELQYLVVCMNSSRWGSSLAPDITVYDDTGEALKLFNADGEEVPYGEADADEVPNLKIENIALAPGATTYLEVDSGAESLGTLDEWYMIKAYVASFRVISYDEDGYSCP